MLFLFTMGMTAGIVVTLNDDAHAIWKCGWECTFQTICSLDTGTYCDDCPGDYIVYKKSTCAGGPLNCPNINEPIACWNGNPPCFFRICDIL
jgi:hypothetical protein